MKDQKQIEVILIDGHMVSVTFPVAEHGSYSVFLDGGLIATTGEYEICRDQVKNLAASLAAEAFDELDPDQTTLGQAHS